MPGYACSVPQGWAPGSHMLQTCLVTEWHVLWVPGRELSALTCHAPSHTHLDPPPKGSSASPPGAAPSQLPWDDSGTHCRISHRAPEGPRPRRHHQAPFVGLLPLCLAPTYLSAIRGCAPHSPRAPSLRCTSGEANITPGDWIQGLQPFHR